VVGWDEAAMAWLLEKLDTWVPTLKLASCSGASRSDETPCFFFATLSSPLRRELNQLT
jgi:hypothetical protein